MFCYYADAVEHSDAALHHRLLSVWRNALRAED